MSVASIFSRKPTVQGGDLDAVTDREVRALYRRDEIALAERVRAVQEIGDEVRVRDLLEPSRLGPRDVVFIVDRVRPLFSRAQREAVIAGLTRLEELDFEGANALLAPAGVDPDDLRTVRNLGLIDAWRAQSARDQLFVGSCQPVAEAIEAQVPVHAVAIADVKPAPPAPGSPDSSSPAPPSAPALPAHIRATSLPDGTDLTDPQVQRDITARIASNWGPTWIPMFPRYDDVDDGVDAVLTVVDSRPGARVRELGPTAKSTDAAAVAVQGEQAGYGTLVEYDVTRRRAIFAALPPNTRLIRDRLAAVLKCEPWLVEVVCHAVDDNGSKRLDQVFVLRSPATAMSSDKRAAVWADLLTTFPGASAGWQILDDPQTGYVRIRFGKPRTLPGLVSAADLLPADYDPAHWESLPFGVTPEGTTASIDLGLGPHILVVGPAGTGKTITMLQIATSALCVGYDLIVVDVAKRGADFKRLKPWTSAWARTNAEAAAVMKAAYDESQRRADIIDRYDEDHWSKLPPEILEREGIRPLLVLIDEFQAFNEIEKIPAGLDRDSPEKAEMEEINAAKIAVVTAARRIIAEARWAGVYICIGTQRAPAETIPVTMRDNCHWKIQLCAPGKTITPSTMGLTFPAEQASEAMAVKLELDDGASRGLALIAGDGGSVVGVRVGLADKPRIAGWLEERDVPKPKPAAPASPVVKEHDEIEFSLDDLEPSAASRPDTVPFTDDDFDRLSPKAAPTRAEFDDFWGAE